MTANESDLDQSLDLLKAESANVRVQVKISAKVERRFYAGVYVWWRQASQIAGYLEASFARNGIDFIPKQNRISWRPLLKLVTDQLITVNDLSLWSKALDTVHADVLRDPAHYAADPIGQIDFFIEQRGGKTGLAGYHSKDEDQFDDQPAVKAQMLFELDDDEFEPAFLSEAEAYFSNVSGTGLLNAPPVHLTNQSFGMVLVRKSRSGVEVLSTSNASQLVREMLISSYRSDLRALPATMRAVIELLHVLNVPRVIAKSFDKFAEYVSVQERAGKGKSARPSNRRLTYRPLTGDFLLSLANVDSSVVIVARPKTSVIDRAAGDLFLPAYVRRSIEVRLLHQRMFNMFAPSGSEQFISAPGNGLTDCFVSLRPKAAIIDLIKASGISETQAHARISNLRHPAIAFVPYIEDGKDHWQAAPKGKAFAPTWQATVSLDWLRDATRTFFDEWIAEYGAKAKREMNLTMRVVFDATGLLISHEFGDSAGWGSTKAIAMSPKPAKGAADMTVRSTDFAFVLRQIGDLEVTGPLHMEADHDALRLTFETGAMSYSVWIPSCNQKGVRSGKKFEPYHPVTIELTTDPFDHHSGWEVDEE
jgi:hypothetical protein